MKKIISLALATLILLSCALTSCGKSKITIPDGDRSYQIQKSGQKRIITVYVNDVEIWETKEKVKSSVDGIDECFGVEVLDLNFDGYSDIKIATSKSDDKISAVCYLQNSTTGLYEESTALAELYTIETLPEQQLVLSYFGITTDMVNGSTVETVIAYKWQGDGLLPYRKLTITHYPIENRYCYGVADYLNGSLQFDEPIERWFTPEEFSQVDLSFFYYFK